ncbi:aldehyde:ferredoxin oxidoreductase [archaeon SCG-AAA382B04]|nr:aldehyde:ferredoxin oxidoreductase [archaeon SCG-AAA382B04]
MKGHVGKILRVDLTNKEIKEIATSQYEEWVGGHGIGSAIFFDLVKDKTIGPFHPDNVVTIMTSPLSGTLAPAAGGRTEIQGIGTIAYPVDWFNRSNFGGQFSGMLKFAGWDGIVVEGKADSPVWLNIIDGDVTIEKADHLWGLDTWETQEEIWRELNGSKDRGYDGWRSVGEGRTTQKPAIATIGPAGENQGRIASILHGKGHAAGQGFGGVFGAKNLKAISVIGTGSIEIANPSDLMEARTWFEENYCYQENDPAHLSPTDGFVQYGYLTKSPGHGLTRAIEPARPYGCQSCPVSCRRRTESGVGSESICVETVYYAAEDTKSSLKATDILQKLGINAHQCELITYLRELYEKGVLEKLDKEIPFDFEEYGTLKFAEDFANAVAYREGIGDDLAKGFARAAERWGRYEEDTKSGLLPLPNWGFKQHYDPRLEVEWPYGSLLGARDINEHDFNWEVHYMPLIRQVVGKEPLLSAEELVNKISEKLIPYQDPEMLDYSEEGLYSMGKVKNISWHRHYTRFWKQSALFCDWVFADFYNTNNPPSMDGFTPKAEPKVFNAVTGKDLSFEDGLELGRKIWNLDRTIWTLQGRHRDQEKFTEYVYNKPTSNPYPLPVHEEGGWKYSQNIGRTLDKEKFEEWKTKYYEFEGWNPDTGWPTKETLESLGMEKMVSELEKNDKLGGKQ